MDEYAEAKFRIFANAGSGRYVRRESRRSDRRRSVRVRTNTRIRARALWFARTSRIATLRSTSATTKRSSTRRRPATRGRSRSCRSTRFRCAERTTSKTSCAAILVGLRGRTRSHRDRRCAFARIRADASSARDRCSIVTASSWIDDSKATNPGSVMAALRAFDRPIVSDRRRQSEGYRFRRARQSDFFTCEGRGVDRGERAEEIGKNVRRA